jgi:hypothetical protein
MDWSAGQFDLPKATPERTVCCLSPSDAGGNAYLEAPFAWRNGPFLPPLVRFFPRCRSTESKPRCEPGGPATIKPISLSRIQQSKTANHAEYAKEEAVGPIKPGPPPGEVSTGFNADPFRVFRVFRGSGCLFQLHEAAIGEAGMRLVSGSGRPAGRPAPEAARCCALQETSTAVSVLAVKQRTDGWSPKRDRAQRNKSQNEHVTLKHSTPSERQNAMDVPNLKPKLRSLNDLRFLEPGSHFSARRPLGFRPDAVVLHESPGVNRAEQQPSTAEMMKTKPTTLRCSVSGVRCSMFPTGSQPSSIFHPPFSLSCCC